MSELEYESFVGCITTFYSPSLFWFIYDEEISPRNNFNDKLNTPSASYSRIEAVSVGQKVIIQYGEEWVRAEIADIKQEKTPKKEYICWLLDYGIFASTTMVYQLPEDAKLVPAFAHKAMLYGLQSMIVNFDFGACAFQEHREAEWVPGIRRCATDILKFPKIIQTFRKRFKFEDYLIGDLYIQHPEEGIFDLGEKIISKGLAKLDEPTFLANLHLTKMVEKSLSTVYLQTRYFVEKDLSKILQNQKRAMGRGTFRSVETYVKESRKKPQEISSSFFSDAECEILLPTQEPRKQVKSSKEKDDPSSGKGRGKKFSDMLASKYQDNISENESDSNSSKSLSNKSDSSSPSGRGFRKGRNNANTSKTELSVTEEIGVNSAMTNLKIYSGRGHRKSLESTEIEQINKDDDYIKFEDAEKMESTVLKNVYPAGVGNLRKNNSKFTQEQKVTTVENTVLGGRGFVKSPEVKSVSPEAVDMSVKRSRGCFIKNKVSYVDENVFENIEEVKSVGRGFKKYSDVSSSSENENSSSVGKMKPIGRGFRKPENPSDSENEHSSSTNGNYSDFKSFGRGFNKSATKSQICISSDDAFNDADEIMSNQSDKSDSNKSSVFRNSTPVLDVVNFHPAGSNVSGNSTQKQNFQCGINQKRPPIGETTKCNEALEVFETSNRNKIYAGPETSKCNKTVVESVKQFKDTFKNEEVVSLTKHNQKAGLGFCECLTCVEWRNNNKVFEPVITEIRKPKEQKVVIKPPLLFKTKDQEKIKFNIHTERIFDNDTEKLAAPRLLVHGYLRAEPASDLPHIPFDENVQMGLRQINYANAYSIQTYAWPAVLRGHNVIVVSVPECGKSMVYVPALCSFMFNRNPFLPEGNGPISVVLCPRVKIVDSLYKLFNNIMKKIKSDVKIAAVTQLYERITMIRLGKGVDILITTPRLLIKMLKQNDFNLDRLCHIVLEEAHDLLSFFSPEIGYIFKKTQRILEKRTVCIPIQLITISQEWTKPIEDLAKKFRIPPLICIGAHLEAALYGKAEIKVQLSASNEKAAKLIELIKDKSTVRKTVIMCNDTDNAKELLNYLDTHGIVFETLLIESSIEDINAIKKRWFHSIPGHYFALVCSDNIFNTGLAITDAEIVVQYSLPENWSQFTFRFSGFLDNYSCPLAVKTEDMSRCLMHIIIDETNRKEFPRMLQFLQRMGTKLTQSLLDLYYQLTGEMEEERLENKIRLCEELLCFGSCRNVISCKFRHMLCPKVDTSLSLPQSGLIKLKVLHTLSPVHYYARLLSFTDSAGVSHDIRDDFSLIASQLLALKEENRKISVLKLKVGAICAVEETDGPTKGSLQRCKILDIIKVNHHIKSVFVRFIDLGIEQHVLRTHIYFLPEHLRHIPAQAVPIYITNIGPPDKDLTWPGRCSVLLRREFKKFGFSQINCYFIGRIKLQLADALFVDDLKLQEVLDDGALVCHKMSVRDTLTKMNALEERPEHLEELYKRCQSYKIALTDYSLPVIKVVKKVEPQVKPSWAHLENLEEFNMVYFCFAKNPESFFVKLCKNNSCMERLNKDIKEEMNKPFYRSVVSAMEGRCYLVQDPVEQIYARAMVTKLKENTAECIFVDFGDDIEVGINELKYLPDDLITQLPFQAIECKLYGIKPSGVDQNWASEASDIFYDIANEPDTDILRSLHVKVMGNGRAQFTGYKQYSVILLDTFEENTIINNLLVDLGWAVQDTEKRIEVDFDQINLKNHINNDEASDDDYLLEYEPNLGNTRENEEIQLQNDMEEDEDNSMTFFVYDIEEFKRELFAKRNKSTEKITEVEENPQVLSTNLRALPMSSPGFSTPKIIWQQTNSQVTLRIQIPCVTEYEVKVLRGRMLSFRTNCREVEYRLDLHLYAKIQSNIDHKVLGLIVLVKMCKVVEEEWPRLIISKEKQRHITYNPSLISVDDDSDDDKPLSKENIMNSKKYGEELEKQIENGPFVHNCGSDTDWSESDIDSERDSDAS